MSRDDWTALRKAIDRGIRRGVAQALQRHKQAGRSIPVWQDGKIVHIPPEEIPCDGGPEETPKA